jgi:hypothetical protein
MFREFDYSEADISRNAGVSARHLYRSLPKIVDLGLINHTRWSGRSKMYKLDANSLATQALEKFVYEIVKMKIQDDSGKTPSIQSRFDKKSEKELVVEK